MANETSSRLWPFRRTRLMTISVIGGVVAVLVLVGTFTLTALNLRHVHASGTGAGCYPTSQPACTFSGHSANAQFETTTSCVITDVYIFVSESMSRSGETTTQTPYVSLGTNSYNSCTDTYSYGGGYDTTGAVQFATSGDSLTATGNITAENYNSDGTTSSTTYAINLTWKGYGKSTRLMQDYHTQSAGYSSLIHMDGTSQVAVASGTLSDGTTNFAATPSTLSQMLYANSGTYVVIQK